MGWNPRSGGLENRLSWGNTRRNVEFRRGPGTNAPRQTNLLNLLHTDSMSTGIFPQKRAGIKDTLTHRNRKHMCGTPQTPPRLSLGNLGQPLPAGPAGDTGGRHASGSSSRIHDTAEIRLFLSTTSREESTRHLMSSPAWACGSPQPSNATHAIAYAGRDALGTSVINDHHLCAHPALPMIPTRADFHPRPSSTHTSHRICHLAPCIRRPSTGTLVQNALRLRFRCRASQMSHLQQRALIEAVSLRLCVSHR